MKTIKKIIAIFFILIALIVGAAIAIPFIFKDKLIEIAKEEINKMVTAEIDFGEFDLSIFKSFPDLNFQIQNVSAIGIDDFKGDTLACFDKFTADVDIMSVFGDNIKVNAIVLEHPVMRAIVLKGGKANWDIAPASEDSVEVVKEESTEPSAFTLNLDRFQIINGDIIYDDRDYNMYAELKNLNFSLEGDMSGGGDLASLSTKTNIDEFTFSYDGVKYMNKTKVEMNIDLDADLVGYKFTLTENTVKLNYLELGFDGWLSMPEDDIDMDLTFKASKTEFKNILSLVPAVYLTDFETVQTSGKLALDGMAKGKYSETTLPGFNINLLIENAMFKYPDLPGSATNINVDLNVNNSDGIDDHTIIDLKKFHVDFENNPIDAHLLVKTPVSDPLLDMQVKGIIDLAKMSNVIPLEDMTLNGVITMDVKMKGKMSMIDNEQYEQFEALGKIAVDNLNFKNEDIPQGILIQHTDMDVSPQFFQLNAFDATIGNSDIHMNGRIDNFLAYAFRDELLKGTFNLNSNKFDANQFLTDDGSSETTEEAPSESEEELTVFEVPKNIDFALNAQFGKFIYDNINIENIIGSIIVKEGKVQMDNLGMNLLQGSMILDGSYDTKDISKPKVDFVMQIKQFDIPTTYKTFNIVQKLAPIAENCQGKVSINIDYKCLLQQNMEPDLASVNAQGRLMTDNIVVTNSKTLEKIADAIKMDMFKKINLNDIDLKFTVEDGNINVEPFTTKFRSSDAVISGRQSIDQSLDFIMALNIPRSEFGGQANQVLDGLLKQAGDKGVNVDMGDKVNVDVLIGGTVTDPKITISLKDQTKNMIEDVKEQVVEKVKEEIDKVKQEAIKKAEAQAAKLYNEADQKGKALIKQAEAKAQQAKDSAKKAADAAKNVTYGEAKSLEDKAKGKPKIVQDAAKKSADKVRSEADTKYNQALKEADTQANNGVDAAKKEHQNLLNSAKKEGDGLILKAKS